MIASAKTIQLLLCDSAAEHETYQLLRQQIWHGWPEHAAAAPLKLREYYTFADELTNSGDFVYKGSCIVVPFEARQEMLVYIAAILELMNAFGAPVTHSTGQEWQTKSILLFSAATSVSSTRQRLHVSHCNHTMYWPISGKTRCEYFCISQPWLYLITADYLCKFFKTERLPSKRTKDIIYSLCQHFTRHCAQWQFAVQLRRVQTVCIKLWILAPDV